MPQQGTIVVTGANGGLGNAIVTNIINQQDLGTNYYGIYTVRDTLRGATTVRRTLERAKSVKHDHELLPIDLGSLESVRNSARNINARVSNGSLPPIRALVLNAGWVEQTTHSFTKDGFDMSFQVNYLSHFLLTLLLLQSMDKERGRIEVLGSWTHEYIIPLSFIKKVVSLIDRPKLTLGACQLVARLIPIIKKAHRQPCIHQKSIGKFSTILSISRILRKASGAPEKSTRAT